MSIIYYFVWTKQENMSDIVSVHWQQGKFLLCANCFMSWRPVSNAGLGISKTPSAAHWCVQRPKHSAMSKTDWHQLQHQTKCLFLRTVTFVRKYNLTISVYSSVPWQTIGSRRITAFVNLICPPDLFLPSVFSCFLKHVKHGKDWYPDRWYVNNDGIIYWLSIAQRR